jgi:hypothetical protein
MAFVGAGMSGVAFSTVAGENLGAAIHVLNVRRIGSNLFGLVPVGTTTRSGDLQLNRNTMKAYGKDLTELPYSEISSKCIDCDAKDRETDYMEVKANKKVHYFSNILIEYIITGVAWKSSHNIELWNRPLRGKHYWIKMRSTSQHGCVPKSSSSCICH